MQGATFISLTDLKIDAAVSAQQGADVIVDLAAVFRDDGARPSRRRRPILLSTLVSGWGRDLRLRDGASAGQSVVNLMRHRGA